MYLTFSSGQPPSPRMDHTAAIHAERYLLIFGGASYATCFNDLHVLDLKIVSAVSILLSPTVPYLAACSISKIK